MKINPQIEWPEFKFTDLMITNKCSMQYVTGNFSCAKGYFVLERELGIVPITLAITGLSQSYYCMTMPGKDTTT